MLYPSSFNFPICQVVFKDMWGVLQTDIFFGVSTSCMKLVLIAEWN